MRKILFTFIGSVFALLVPGCADMGEPPAGPDNGNRDGVEERLVQPFAYSGYDGGGRLAVQGVLRIVLDDSNDVTGTWELSTAVGVPPEGLGPQLGKGNLVGSMDGLRIGINLNPNYIDNNVLLAGTCAVAPWKGIWITRITGTWAYVGFPGVLREGTFIAERLPFPGFSVRE
jgi:hypothetical protein